mmetsp:Transcript_18593/g.52933  ORF Transcript_18593/g.52933 Transcript_18593/m.52933 type:complete len:204 (-) Transcript_18593:711-1322(-)
MPRARPPFSFATSWNSVLHSIRKWPRSARPAAASQLKCPPARCVFLRTPSWPPGPFSAWRRPAPRRHLLSRAPAAPQKARPRGPLVVFFPRPTPAPWDSSGASATRRARPGPPPGPVSATRRPSPPRPRRPRASSLTISTHLPLSATCRGPRRPRTLGATAARSAAAAGGRRPWFVWRGPSSRRWVLQRRAPASRARAAPSAN